MDLAEGTKPRKQLGGVNDARCLHNPGFGAICEIVSL